jgi:DNA modification methylase
VVDPFCGRGTTAVAAKQLGAGYLCNELSAEYVAYAEKRLTKTSYRPKMDFILPEQSEMALA